MAPMTATPPTTPPAMAPTGVDFWDSTWVGVGEVELDDDDDDETDVEDEDGEVMVLLVEGIDVESEDSVAGPSV